MDVFVRSSKVKELEIHCVALLKAMDSSVLVVDPNNSSFSSVLQGPGVSLMDKSAFIYKGTPAGRDASTCPAGRHPTQWRDCADVAAKLALRFLRDDAGLAEFTTNARGRVDIKQLKSATRTTNQVRCDRQLPAQASSVVWRDGQSSDFDRSDRIRAHVRQARALSASRVSESNAEAFDAALVAVLTYGGRGVRGCQREHHRGLSRNFIEYMPVLN